MRIESQMLPACCQDATAAEAAVVEEMQSAGEKLRGARKDKAQAKADKLHEMREVTKKLREIADKTRNSGLVNFGIAFVSAGIKTTSVCRNGKIRDPAKIGAELVSATQHLNPYSMQLKDLNADRSAHETAQERASGLEGIAKDAVDEAKRLASASLQRLEEMQRMEHEGQLAILRG